MTSTATITDKKACNTYLALHCLDNRILCAYREICFGANVFKLYISAHFGANVFKLRVHAMIVTHCLQSV